MFSKTKNPFLNGTSCQTMAFKEDAIKFLKISNFNPLSLKYYKNWQYMARKMFLHARKKGGIFHLWGHSWEVEQQKMWKELERFFKWLSKQENVEFVTNGQL